mgnify:CR=1 FL=1
MRCGRSNEDGDEFGGQKRDDTKNEKKREMNDVLDHNVLSPSSSVALLNVKSVTFSDVKIVALEETMRSGELSEKSRITKSIKLDDRTLD